MPLKRGEVSTRKVNPSRERRGGGNLNEAWDQYRTSDGDSHARGGLIRSSSGLVGTQAPPQKKLHVNAVGGGGWGGGGGGHDRALRKGELKAVTSLSACIEFRGNELAMNSEARFLQKEREMGSKRKRDFV